MADEPNVPDSPQYPERRPVLRKPAGVTDLDGEIAQTAARSRLALPAVPKPQTEPDAGPARHDSPPAPDEPAPAQPDVEPARREGASTRGDAPPDVGRDRTEQTAAGQLRPASPQVRRRSQAADAETARQRASESLREVVIDRELLSSQVKIGLWGSPASGKTTFLGALLQAVDDSGRHAAWTISPLSRESRELMIRLNNSLVIDQAFPEKTLFGQYTALSWLFSGGSAMTRASNRRRPWRRADAPGKREFVLDLIDVSGEAFSSTVNSEVPAHIRALALDHLEQADGLIYLFDPVRERDDQISANYFNRTIVELSERMARSRRLIGPYLPHEISVCITKFDDPQVFQRLRRHGFVDEDRSGQYRVHDNNAEALFNALCDGSLWADRALHGGAPEVGPMSAQFVRRELKKRFHPDRIRYFVTSSVGFKQQRTHEVDPEKFMNVMPTKDEAGQTIHKILGPINPINVLEPVTSLEHRISRRR